jgi:hypothetical protein
MLTEFRFSWPDSVLRNGGLAVICIALMTGCAAPAPPPVPPAVAQPLPEVAARFATAPERFIAALPETCTAPNQRVLRPAPSVTECRMLMTPEATAGAILRYGGTIAQLPETVIRLRVENEGTGVLLHAASYLEVPQASGGVLRVVYPDPVLDARLRAVLVELGGTLP